MAGFRKAISQQAALKMGLYGEQGSGKTVSAMRFAEGLAKKYNKRFALVETEIGGTDFLLKTIPERTFHPEPFDFDRLATKEITRILREVKELDPNVYCALVIDSMTHIWEACINAYGGKLNAIGAVPIHAWGTIKRPYKELIHFILTSPLHIFICGRQGNKFEKNSVTGESEWAGYKMQAEKETGYEPHILLKMQSVVNPNSGNITITALVEKDRSSVIQGQLIAWPDFDNTIAPILPYLDETQAAIPTDDESSRKDAEVLAEQERKRAEESAALLKKYKAHIELATDWEALDAIGKELTPEVKKKMKPEGVTELRTVFLEAQKKYPKPAKEGKK